ncbi:MAG TPA: hypothetical protein VIR16_07845 [Candidatus Limnocylindrales bacterium]
MAEWKWLERVDGQRPLRVARPRESSANDAESDRLLELGHLVGNRALSEMLGAGRTAVQRQPAETAEATGTATAGAREAAPSVDDASAVVGILSAAQASLDADPPDVQGASVQVEAARSAAVGMAADGGSKIGRMAREARDRVLGPVINKVRNIRATVVKVLQTARMTGQRILAHPFVRLRRTARDIAEIARQLSGR